MRILVVWEPVLLTDWAAPGATALSRVADARVRQYWDSGRLLSKALGEHDRNSIVWDEVLVYAAGAVWSDKPPAPVYQGGPVVRVAEPFRRALDQFTTLSLRQQ